MQGQSTSNRKSLSEPRSPPPPPPPVPPSPGDKADEPLEIIFAEELAAENPAPGEDEAGLEEKGG